MVWVRKVRAAGVRPQLENVHSSVSRIDVQLMMMSLLLLLMMKMLLAITTLARSSSVSARDAAGGSDPLAMRSVLVSVLWMLKQVSSCQRYSRCVIRGPSAADEACADH